jgi:NADPH2:quinone reductase
MKAYVCKRVGAEGYAEIDEVPDPEAGPGELVIEARAMSVNFPDVLQIAGLYQRTPEVPFIIGMEYAGVVASVGEGVHGFSIGDRVAGMTQGAFAERVWAPAAHCYPLPAGIDFDQGACLTLAGGTALYGLKYRGALQRGETLAVLGASGGTGSFAVQVGRALGARVLAVCSSEEKAAIAKDAGAHEVIDLSRDDLGNALKVHTNGRGVDVVYDPVGGDAFDVACRRIAWNGRILTVGYAAGRIPNLPINLALVKGYSLTGVHWAAAIQTETALARTIVAELFALVEKGEVSAHVDSRWPLAGVGAALDKMKTRRVTGKLVLQS